MENIKFSQEDDLFYAQYLRLKFDIFYREFNWPLSVDENRGSCKADRFDRDAMFFGTLASNQLVGVLRCSPVAADYPYRAIFESYIARAGIPADQFCILTSIAFLPHYRCSYQARQGTVIASHARSLFSHTLDELEARGISEVLLTAGVSRSEKVFQSWGFDAISPVFRLGHAPVDLRNYSYSLQSEHRQIARFNTLINYGNLEGKSNSITGGKHESAN